MSYSRPDGVVVINMFGCRNCCPARWPFDWVLGKDDGQGKSLSWQKVSVCSSVGSEVVALPRLSNHSVGGVLVVCGVRSKLEPSLVDPGFLFGYLWGGRNDAL